MAVLAFDTSTAQGSVALVEGDLVLSHRVWLREKSHSEFLTAEIDAVLKEANILPKNLRALAITHGPGSFTGLRVAVNAAKSLGYALKLKTYAFTTGAILVQNVKRFDLPVMTLINAQKNAFFAARYTHDGKMWVSESTEPQIVELHDLSTLITSPHLVIGDGCIDLDSHLPPDVRPHFIRDITISDYPDARELGLLSERSVKSVEPLVWNALQALYIRASGAEEKLREGLKR